MTRYLLATVAGTLLASAAMAQMPPKTMAPAKPEAPPTSVPAKPATTAAPMAASPMMAMPMPTEPTISHAMVSEATCDASGCCTTRPGILARMSSRWCGHRTACVDPVSCNTSFPSYGSYTPVYVTYASGCVQSDDRCGRFGLGRFFNRCGKPERCRTSPLLRLKAWFSLRGASDGCSQAVPMPYQSPIRYYFQPDGEPTGGTANCGASGETKYVGCTGGPRVALGSGIGSGRLRAAVQGDGCRGGHCKREQCYDLPGSPLAGNVRFARDEKSAVPPLNAGRPTEYGGEGYPGGYSTKPEENTNVIPASHTARKR